MKGGESECDKFRELDTAGVATSAIACANYVFCCLQDWWSALMMAIQKGHSKVAEKLILAGAKLDLQNKVDVCVCVCVREGARMCALQMYAIFLSVFFLFLPLCNYLSLSLSHSRFLTLCHKARAICHSLKHIISFSLLFNLSLFHVCAQSLSFSLS